MKVINTQNLLVVSGGCQKAIDKYEMSTTFYEFVGNIAGIAIGVTTQDSIPLKIVGGFVGHYVGSEAGYAFGAVSYWVNRAIHKTTDGVLKPTL